MNAPSASRLALGALLGALLLTATGCVFSIGPTTRNPYEACNSTDSCQGGSTCATSNVASGAMLCTATCTASAQCPADPGGFDVMCVTEGAATSGQCYRACGSGGTCQLGFVCNTTGSTPFCQPNTGATTCGGAGQQCCSGNTCNTGFACNTSNRCTACGNVGEPCCAGTTCTAAGAACGSDGLCRLAPYSGCSGGSVGASCLGGLNASGAAVATTCQRPLIGNPGADAFCTATCSASAAECPTSPIAGRTSNCYILQGAAQGQCFVDCAGGQTCPANTVCAMTPTSTGGQVQICMPNPGA